MDFECLTETLESIRTGVDDLLERFEKMQFGSETEKAVWTYYERLRYTLEEYKGYLDEDISGSTLYK